MTRKVETSTVSTLFEHLYLSIIFFWKLLTLTSLHLKEKYLSVKVLE